MGHTSYVLLILSSLMRRMFWLRAFFIASALTGISYSVFWLADPVGVFWESLLLIVNITQLVLLASKDARASFSTEKKDFIEGWLSGGTPSSRRAILNLGSWERLKAGTQLTTRGERPLWQLASIITRIRRDVAEDAEVGMTQDPDPQAPAAQDDFPRDDLAPLDDDKTHDDAHPVFSDYASI